MVDGTVRERNLSRAENVYLRLREAIREGTLPSGYRLRESELAERFSVSRTPIREAIRRLTSEGLIEDVAGRGLSVTGFSMQQVRELYFLRSTLEGAAAAQAAQYASPPEIRSLEGLLALSRSEFDQPGETARINRLFHKTIYEAARNRYLSAALDKLSDFLALLPGTTFEEPGRAEQALDEHEAILDGIRRRDPAAAERAARAHINQAGETRIMMMFREDS